MEFNLNFQRWNEWHLDQLSSITTDKITSLVWTNRYSGIGDFVMTLRAQDCPADIAIDQILEAEPGKCDVSGGMIIERIHINRTADGNDIVTLSGRSTESYLTRMTTSTGINDVRWRNLNVGQIIEGMLSISNWSGSDFFYEDPSIASEPVMPGQDYMALDYYYGAGPMDKLPVNEALKISPMDYINAVQQITQKPFGIRTKKVYYGSVDMIAYRGKDKTKDVIFSTANGSLASMEYEKDITDALNYVVCDGNTGGVFSETATLNNQNYNRITVRSAAIWNAANDASKPEVTEGIWRESAEKFLRDHPIQERITAEAANDGIYQYGRDYGLGDTVTVDPGLGPTITARVGEVTFSYDQNGGYWHPTLEIIKE